MKELIIVMFLSLILIGTLGFYNIENMSLLDSFYLTVASVTTVGYGDVVPVTPIGKIFASGLIIGGILVFAVVIAHVGGLFLTSKIEEVLGFVRKKQRMKNHVVLCGAGRVGKVIIDELKKAKKGFVVVERDTERVKELTQEKIPAIYGDVLNEQVLKDAGIKNAKVLISALDKDADAVFLVVTAKSLNPNIKVIVQVNEQKNIDKMYKVGANEVVCPQVAGARMLAHAAIGK